MSFGTSNRDGGKTSESGHLRAIQKVIAGEVLSGLNVSQRAAGVNMSVDIAVGDAVLPRSDGTYGHPVYNDAVYNLAISAADPANPRRDIVILYVDYGVTPSTGVSNNTNGVVAVKVVAGTAAGSPVDPTDVALQAAAGSGNPYIKLARVRVGAAATSISNSVIDDQRCLASGLLNGGFTGASGLVPVYSSASVLQLSNVDATGIFAPNTKIRLYQGGSLKEFIVTSSSFSTHTLVNLDGRGVYTLSNTPIDKLQYSYDENPVNFSLTRRSDFVKNHIASGCVWSADAAGSTRAASMSAGVVYINGKPLTVAAVTARLFTASKDVYIGFNDAGDGTATVVYYDNTTNAASPSLATAGYTMLGAIIQVGASNIVSADRVNNGYIYTDVANAYPVVSSVPLVTVDSIGNLIGNRRSSRAIIAKRGLSSSPAPTVEADIAASPLVINLPVAQDVEITFGAHFQINNGGDRSLYYKLYIDGASVHQIYMRDNPGASETHAYLSDYYTANLAAGSHTIKIRTVATASSAMAINGGWVRAETKAY